MRLSKKLSENVNRSSRDPSRAAVPAVAGVSAGGVWATARVETRQGRGAMIDQMLYQWVDDHPVAAALILVFMAAVAVLTIYAILTV